MSMWRALRVCGRQDTTLEERKYSTLMYSLVELKGTIMYFAWCPFFRSHSSPKARTICCGCAMVCYTSPTLTWPCVVTCLVTQTLLFTRRHIEETLEVTGYRLLRSDTALLGSSLPTDGEIRPEFVQWIQSGQCHGVQLRSTCWSCRGSLRIIFVYDWKMSSYTVKLPVAVMVTISWGFNIHFRFKKLLEFVS